MDRDCYKWSIHSYTPNLLSWMLCSYWRRFESKPWFLDFGFIQDTCVNKSKTSISLVRKLLSDHKYIWGAGRGKGDKGICYVNNVMFDHERKGFHRKYDFSKKSPLDIGFNYRNLSVATEILTTSLFTLWFLASLCSKD